MGRQQLHLVAIVQTFFMQLFCIEIQICFQIQFLSKNLIFNFLLFFIYKRILTKSMHIIALFTKIITLFILCVHFSLNNKTKPFVKCNIVQLPPVGLKAPVICEFCWGVTVLTYTLRCWRRKVATCNWSLILVGITY